MATKELISTITVGAGGAASIVFSSIPQNYTDLMIVVSGRGSSTASDANMQFNGSDGSFRRLSGDGSAPSTDAAAGMIFFVGKSTQTANTFNNAQIYIPNYAGSTNKSVSIDSVSENNGTQGYQGIAAALWSNTAAITSISLLTTNWVQYSTASLYGFKKGSDGITTVA